MSQSLSLKNIPQQHDAATIMLHRRDGARFSLNVMLCIKAKEFNLGVIRPENVVSRGLRVFRCLLANSKWAGMCLLMKSGHKGLIGGVLQRWLSFWKVLPSPQRNSGALSVNIRFLVTSLTKTLLPRFLSLAGQPALGTVLVVPNFFHSSWGPSMLQNIFNTLPQIGASTQSCLCLWL